MTYHDFEIYFALIVFTYCIAVLLSLSIRAMLHAWASLINDSKEKSNEG